MRNGILTINEAASLIGISPNSLRTMCREQLIHHMKVGPKGGVYRFRREWIDEYLEASQVPVADRKPTVAEPKKRETATLDASEFQDYSYYKNRIKELKKQVGQTG